MQGGGPSEDGEGHGDKKSLKDMERRAQKRQKPAAVAATPRNPELWWEYQHEPLTEVAVVLFFCLVLILGEWGGWRSTRTFDLLIAGFFCNKSTVNKSTVRWKRRF